jgi:tRNA(Met) cytidine acetyltransferase
VRVAVHPAFVQRGIGRRLLRTLERDGRAERMDLIGASFGATSHLIRFWRRCGYRPVHLGTRRNAASGEYALVVLRRLTARGWSFAIAAESRFAARLAVLFAGPLRGLDPGVGATILGTLRAGSPPLLETGLTTGLDTDHELDGFVSGHRSLDATLPLLAEITHRHLGEGLRSGVLDIEDAALLLAATCQLRPTGELVEHFEASGRAALIARLRQAVGGLRLAAIGRRASIPSP